MVYSSLLLAAPEYIRDGVINLLAWQGGGNDGRNVQIIGLGHDIRTACVGDNNSVVAPGAGGVDEPCATRAIIKIQVDPVMRLMDKAP